MKKRTTTNTSHKTAGNVSALRPPQTYPKNGC